MGKGGGKGHTPVEAKDNLKSTQMMSVIDAIGEGPIEGPVKGLQSILVNKTPLTDTDGNPVIHGVTAVWRAGEQEQTPPEGFESSGSETALGVEVTKAKPVTRTITSANIDRLRVTFGVQSLLETTSKGDRNHSSVRLLIQLQRNGNWVTEKDVTINGKTTSQFLASVILDNLPPRPFNIRMVRETADSTTDQLQNRTLWSSYTEIIDVKQCYPNTAIVGLQVDAEQFGGQQMTVNYHIRGRIIQVPSNYDPEKRTYSGIWDGSLKPAYSNNPAWCLWDMLTHPRYGMGKRLGAADVDKWALYAIVTLPETGAATVNLINGSGKPVSVDITAHPAPDRIQVSTLPDGVETYGVWGLSLPSLRRRLFRCVSVRENTDGTFAITAVQHVPEKEAIVDNGARFEPQSGSLNSVIPPAVQHLTVEVSAADGQYLAQAKWDTPRVVKGVRFSLRLTSGKGTDARLVTTAITADTEHRFSGLPLGEYTLTVRAINSYGQQGEPATTTFRIAAPAAPSRIELTPGYFQITATPHLAVYDPTVQFEFWFSEKRIADIRQVETAARYLGSALYWIAASINIKPGHDYYFYIRSVNTVGKSAFVEAVGRASDDAEGYLDFFKGEIGKTHLAQELWTQIDNGQLAPDLAEIRTSITNVSNEITQTVNKKLENQSAAIQQIQKVQVDTNNNLNSMWAVKLQQMQDGRLYIAGIGAGIENTPAGMQSQVLLAADRIAMINPANGNTKPMFVGQGDQIFMNEVFLKYLTAPTITSGGNPPAFSLTPDGRLTAKNADISGNVNANSGTLNNVTINENCRVLGKLSANQIEGDLVKTVGKAFPRDSRAPERWPSGTITVRVYDDQPFDRQIVIPAVAFSGAKHEKEHTDIYSSCRLIVRKNGAEIYNRTALDNTLIYSGVIDMPAGHGHMTLEFSVSAWLVNNWYPTASISDLLVVVMKKATAGITIS
ncbi:host specificity protein J [Escherichia coli]|uniref:host specificity protein J n=5 Tax=Escherichia coli TaxID=562 RepID=UPI000FD8FC6D|nr:host specificity protein J [Escherichia coli]MBN3595623.1 host specificity protein J [Escherichia coli]MBN3600501.1 host specificity protein J [Escherichia coli]MBN3634959.1 host specificity protein J [Escherichia coli]MBN3640413.1 host specificity protein J [Escherichia coli]MBN3655643.1 host specificity protein J [Escherichia coli]